MGNRPFRGCGFLLAILILRLISFPVLEDLARPTLLVAVIAAVFVAGVLLIDPAPHHVKTAVGLAVLQIVLTGLPALLTPDSYPYLVLAGIGLATTALLIFHCQD